MNSERISAFIAVATLLCGCHSVISRLNPDCHTKQEYQRARQVPSLVVPQGLDSPNTQGSLVIPTVDLAPPPPGPKDACLDMPPRYKPASPPNKAASPG